MGRARLVENTGVEGGTGCWPLTRMVSTAIGDVAAFIDEQIFVNIGDADVIHNKLFVDFEVAVAIHAQIVVFDEVADLIHEQVFVSFEVADLIHSKFVPNHSKLVPIHSKLVPIHSKLLVIHGELLLIHSELLVKVEVLDLINGEFQAIVDATDVNDGDLLLACEISVVAIPPPVLNRGPL